MHASGRKPRPPTTMNDNVSEYVRTRSPSPCAHFEMQRARKLKEREVWLTFDEKGILYAKSRIPCFTEIKTILNNVELKDVGIQSRIFFLGRFTQITKPIIMYFHHHISYHGGRDSTLKHLNAVVSIYKGTPIIKSIVNKCIQCKVKNKRKSILF